MGLQQPRLGLAVLPSQPPIKLPGQPADRRFVSYIGGSQAAGGHSAQAPARLQEDRPAAHARGLNGRDNPAGRAAVNAHVDLGIGFGHGGKTPTGGEYQTEKSHAIDIKLKESRITLRPKTANAVTKC
jgi:hypothetical protein